MVENYENSEHNRMVLLLEAVRAGIPTRSLVGALPDLRQKLTDSIDTDLEGLAGGKQVKGRVIWGSYGQGKTHFLKTVEKRILEQGFAVSYFSLNRDLGLNNLFNLFPALSSHVLTRETNIPGLLNQLAGHRLSLPMLETLFELCSGISHPLPRLIFESFIKYDANEMILLYNALMGKKENITVAKQLVRSFQKFEYKKMPKFVQREHLISFVEFFSLLVKSLGYKGWVILIDELEIVGRMGRVSRLNSYKNLSWLMNLSGEHKLPIYTLVASADALNADVFRGARKQDAIEMPILAQERFGDTTAKLLTKFFDLITGSQGMVLTPLKPKDYIVLLDKLLEIHQEAIPWKHELPENMVQDTLKRIDPSTKPVRQILRMFIETLDLYSTVGIIPGKFNDNLQELYDFDSELPHLPEEDSNNETSGFRETPLKDMFDA
ncbi:MAG: DUF2791 family P-loop domain-containing protein [Candidatus Cloacimonetes bacterium]|nr:DUF2791 family P-loop domain-containing protein [Candidatus Cloacimonadota bacterium]